MNTKDVNVPGWVWWGTLAGVAGILAITALGAIWLAAGAADPPVAGPVIWSDADRAWLSDPVIALAPGENVWLTAPDSAHLPPDAFTLDVSARITLESDPGTAWGVWLETESGARVIYAISGEGYTTTRMCDSHPTQLEDCPALRPEWRWMPYPRIHSPGTTNTITLHVETTDGENHAGGSEVRLRLNREIMGAAAIQWSGRWGVWLRGGRAARASGVAGTLQFINVTLRA